MNCLACVTGSLRCILINTEATRAGGLRACNVRYLSVETSRGCDRDGSRIRAEYPITMRESLGGVMQKATTPAVLCARQGSMKDEVFLKSRPSPENEASAHQALLRANAEDRGRRQRGGTESYGQIESTRKGNPGSSKVAVRARLQDYSSKTIKGEKRVMHSSRSTKASTDFRNGTQSHKDQREPWQIQKRALSEKLGPTGWMPRKRLSPDALEGIRALHAQYPEKFTTPVLADQFKVSPEAIRRILKSKWRPKDEEEERRRRRWEKRGENIWSQMVEMGIKPPKKWREMGVGKSSERKSAQSKQLESQIKSKSRTSSLGGQSSIKFRTITANGHEISSPVLLADRIL